MKKTILLAFLLISVLTSYAQKQSFQTKELTVDIKGINGKFMKSTYKTNIIIGIEDNEIILTKDSETLSKWKILNTQTTGADIVYLIISDKIKDPEVKVLILSRDCNLNSVQKQITL